MRRTLSFAVNGATCAATLDEAAGQHGLLIVSGGNEIRSGAHRGMARLAATLAEAGFPVLRFDRRGIGDSEGENAGFEGSADDIAAALALFRATCPHLTHVTAFGNCDAAAALILHHRANGPDALLLANPWTIDAAAPAAPDAADTEGAPALPPAASIRARYLAKLRDPREWLRLLRGGVDLGKLAKGLRAASSQPPASHLATRLAAAGAAIDAPMTLLIATGDGTAQAFMAEWTTPTFAAMRARAQLRKCDTPSHSFADDMSRSWLTQQIINALTHERRTALPSLQ